MSNETEFKLSSEAYERGRKDTVKSIIKSAEQYAQDLEQLELYERAAGVRSIIAILRRANPDL